MLVLWWGAVALSLRCLFETVLDPYYFYPSLAVALVVAAHASKTRFALSVLCGAACTRLTYTHLGPWPYYVATVGTLALTLFLARPSKRSQSTDVDLAPEPGAPSSAPIGL